MITSQYFNITSDASIFASNRHISNKQHCSVWVKSLTNVWSQIPYNDFDLVNNSIILDTALLSTIYSQVELRVADSQEELGTPVTDISTTASIRDEVIVVADNIDSITTVSDNITNLNNIADNIVKAGVVADNMNSIVMVADDLTNINIVSSNKTNIDIAASNITEIQNASTNASVAITKALEASSSATSAYNSSVSAANSSTNASNSEIKASKWADNNYNVEVENGKYSAKHWATVSQNSVGIKVVENISSLKAFNINEANQIDALGYYTKGDGGGGLFYWDSSSTETDNGGTIIQSNGITTGRWKRVFSGAVNVKWFGAKGDNIQDDTDYINKALSLGSGISFQKSTYKITNSLNYTGTKSIFIDGGGATLNCVSPEMGTVLYINPSEDIDFCLVKNLKISGNNIAKIGIHIDTRINRIADIRIDDNAILDLDNVSTVASTSGIIVEAYNNSTLDITSNFIYNIKRTQVNPGIIASVGIGVYGLETVANISNNAINGVSSPVGDDDADGIQVFSKNRLEPNVRQSAMPSISNNRIQKVKGRFVKLQSSNGKVYSNYMSNDGIELVDSFRAVDAQTGGVDIFDNTIRIGTFTGGNNLTLFSLQMKSTGDNENAYTVKNNQITLEQDIRYGCFLYPDTNSSATVLIDGNIIQDKTNTFVCEYFVNASVAENMSKYMIKISNNIVPLGTGGSLFSFYQGTLALLANATTGSLISNILKLHITDNIASLAVTNSNLISNISFEGNYPYLQYLTILGNSNFNSNSVYCQGMDIKKLPEGTSFYYGTDGTALGGLVNAPAYFNRYVSVETPSRDSVRLWAYNNSSYVVYNKTSGASFKYTGVAV